MMRTKKFDRFGYTLERSQERLSWDGAVSSTTVHARFFDVANETFDKYHPTFTVSVVLSTEKAPEDLRFEVDSRDVTCAIDAGVIASAFGDNENQVARLLDALHKMTRYVEGSWYGEVFKESDAGRVKATLPYWVEQEANFGTVIADSEDEARRIFLTKTAAADNMSAIMSEWNMYSMRIDTEEIKVKEYPTEAEVFAAPTFDTFTQEQIDEARERGRVEQERRDEADRKRKEEREARERERAEAEAAEAEAAEAEAAEAEEVTAEA
jgi:hypothetical protein